MAVLEKIAQAPSRARATGLSLTSWVLFASSGPLAEAVMEAGWSPAAVTSVRIALAAVLLAPVVAVLRPQALRFRRADLWLLFSYGLLGVAGVQLFFFLAVARVPVGVAMVLVNLAPALVALWVRVVRRTRLSGLVWLGIGLAVAGLALVARIWQGTRLDLLGVAAGLAAAICSAGYFLLGEHGASRHDSLGLTAGALTIGAVVVLMVSPPWTLPAGLLTAPALLGGLGTPVWLALLVLAVVGTVLPYLAGLLALRALPSAMASVLALVEPLVAAVLAWLLLGQALSLTQLAGAVILLAGAVLVQRGTPTTRQPTHERHRTRRTRKLGTSETAPRYPRDSLAPHGCRDEGRDLHLPDGSQGSDTGNAPIRLPAAEAIRTARVVADASLSDELITTLATICRRPITRRSDECIVDGERTGLIYVGPTRPENLPDGRLRWFHSTNAGVDALLRDGRWPPDTLLTRTVGRMAERIAQYVLTWILAECQSVPAFVDQHRKRTWQRLPTHLVGGGLAVVFGVGRIGAAVCELLHRCGLRTVGVAGHPRPVSGCDHVISVEQVPEVLPEARWVVSALPLTPATEGLFDGDLFAVLRGATFINVGRGATVDFGALAAALADGTVGGAVLDVLADEPAGPEADCWGLPRTVITSHSAGVTGDDDVAGDFAACWAELENGRVPRLAVLPGRGY